jgi:hypothetical protein
VPSADGSTYGAWNTNLSPGSATVFALEGDTVRRRDEGTLGHVAPGPDGRVLFTAKGPVSSLFKRLHPEDDKAGYCLPATDPDFYVALEPRVGLTVRLMGHADPVAKLDLDHGLSFDGWDRDASGPWQRLFFIPQANLIVVLPESNDRVMLHRFDVDAALERSGLDYFVVTSRPPATAKRGTELSYAVAVKAKDDKITYRVGSGPRGMTVSQAGVVRWAVPAEGKETESEVILNLRNGSRERFHTFTLRLVK